MKKSKKRFRIVQVTYGDTRKEFILEKRTWFGKWVNAYPAFDRFPETTFMTQEQAELAYASLNVDPIAEVVKEYD